jgi:hypothetical protein
MVGLMSRPLSAAPPSQENQYLIASPTEGAVVSGQVEIIGTVTHPSFYSYAVFYAPGPVPSSSSAWVPIVLDVQEPVSNGVLAVWDTTLLDEAGQPLVPNGVYHMTLVRWREGSTDPDQVFVRNITVNNADITPTPSEPTATPEPMPTEVGGDIATPVPIEQPPTATPRPTATAEPGETPGAGAESEGEGTGSPLAIDVEQLRAAFLDGVQITLLLFAFWGVYVLVKAIVRYFMRTRNVNIELPPLPWRKD